MDDFFDFNPVASRDNLQPTVEDASDSDEDSSPSTWPFPDDGPLLYEIGGELGHLASLFPSSRSDWDFDW